MKPDHRRQTRIIAARVALGTGLLALCAVVAESRVTHLNVAPSVRISEEALRAMPDPETTALRVSRTGLRAVLVPAWRGHTAFYRSDLLERDPDLDLKALRASLHARSLRLYAVCPIFDDPDVLREHPEQTPVDQAGRPWSGPGAPLSPLDPGFRANRIARLVELTRILRPDAIVLDAVAWPNVGDRLIGDPSEWPADHALYDFSDRVVEAFLKATGLAVPEHAAADPVVRNRWILGLHPSEWIRWRCDVLATFPAEAVAAVRAFDPDMKFYLAASPYPGDLGRRIAGQDLPQLAQAVDAVIPVAWHERLERGRHWVKQVTEQSRALCGRPVWMELESTLAGRAGFDAIEDLEAVVDLAIEGGAEGLVFSDWEAFEKAKDRDAERKRKLVYGYFR